MNTAEIQNEFAVHIEPEVVVAGELEDDIMSPGIQTVYGLGKRRFHLHSEEIIGILLSDPVELFTFSGVGIRKLISAYIRTISERRVMSLL